MRLVWHSNRPSFTVAVVMMFILGCALVTYAMWSKPVAEADAALRAGDLQAAMKLYAVSEARFDQLRFTKQLLRPDFERIESNQLWLLYALEQFDDTIERSDSYAAIPGSHFWAGCALFEKARAEAQVKGRILWLGRAQEEFRKALELTPDDWDAKFNYEITGRLLAALRKQPEKAPPMEMEMEMLRPKGKDEPIKKPKIG
ncbi:MAG: hypothetical protein HYX76_09250 [Acidobacteria bacterium]|nr:hypothetical protein [Acidobacteriota bacterium]